MKEKSLNTFVESLHSHIKNYQKDINNPEGWPSFYKKELKIIFPEFTFEEDFSTFKAKIERMFDLQLFAYLYVKLTNLSNYSKNNHEKTEKNKELMIKLLSKISEQEYSMIKSLLKTNKYGLN